LRRTVGMLVLAGVTDLSEHDVRCSLGSHALGLADKLAFKRVGQGKRSSTGRSAWRSEGYSTSWLDGFSRNWPETLKWLPHLLGSSFLSSTHILLILRLHLQMQNDAAPVGRWLVLKHGLCG